MIDLENAPYQEIVRRLASLEAPGLILFVAIETYGVEKTAALALALNKLENHPTFQKAMRQNPLSKLSKLNAFPIIAQATHGYIRYGSPKIIKALLEKIEKEYDLSGDILKLNVMRYPISEDLKKKVLAYIEMYPVQSSDRPRQEPI